MNINVKTQFDANTIITTAELHGEQDHMAEIQRQVIQLRDEGVRRALIEMGWTPPQTATECIRHRPRGTEQELRGMLADLNREVHQRTEPILKALAEIEAMRPPAPFAWSVVDALRTPAPFVCGWTALVARGQHVWVAEQFPQPGHNIRYTCRNCGMPKSDSHLNDCPVS